MAQTLQLFIDTILRGTGIDKATRELNKLTSKSTKLTSQLGAVNQQIAQKQLAFQRVTQGKRKDEYQQELMALKGRRLNLRENLAGNKTKLDSVKKQMGSMKQAAGKTVEMADAEFELQRQLSNSKQQFEKGSEKIKNNNLQLISNSKQINQVRDQFDSLGGVIRMPYKVWRRFNEEGSKFKTVGGKTGNTIRMLTHGLGKFKMELLSVMFFGMGMQRFFVGLVRPSLEMVGVFELFSAILGIMFLPLAFQVLNWVIGLYKWWSTLSPATQKFINILVGLGIVFGTLLFLFGMFGLGIGGIITAFESVGVASAYLASTFGLGLLPIIGILAAVGLGVYALGVILDNWGKDTSKVIGGIILLLGTLAIAVGLIVAPWLIIPGIIAAAIGMIIIQFDRLKNLWKNLSHESQKTAAGFGMAFMGAVIGNFIFPGLGALIGGALGFIANYFLFRSDAPVGPLKPETWGKNFMQAFAEGAQKNLVYSMDPLIDAMANVLEIKANDLGAKFGKAFAGRAAYVTYRKPGLAEMVPPMGIYETTQPYPQVARQEELWVTFDQTSYKIDTLTEAWSAYYELFDKYNKIESDNILTIQAKNKRLEELNTIFRSIIPNFDELKSKTDLNTQGFQNMGFAIDELGQKMSKADYLFEHWGENIKTGGEVFGGKFMYPGEEGYIGARSSAEQAAIAIGGTINSITEQYNQVSASTNQVATEVNSMCKSVRDDWNNVCYTWENSTSAARTNISKEWNGMEVDANKAFITGSLVTVFDNAINMMLSSFDKLPIKAKEIWSNIQTTLSAPVTLMMNVTAYVTEYLTKYIEEVVTKSTAMQHGGIVTKPTLATIGEAGPEAVIPLGEGMGIGDVTINNYITANNITDLDRIKRIVSDELATELTRTFSRTR